MITFMRDSKRQAFRDILFVSILAFAVPGTTNARTWTSRSGDAARSGSATVQALYRQIGTDPSFKRLIDNEIIPVGRNSRGGVEGSTIDVNNARVERGVNAANPIPRRIGIHTLCHSHIDRDEFHRWTRWYQEDGDTQVFRLFKGEHNVRNSRPDAARIEAFSKLKWRQGEWHEWVGTYTIVKPHGCMIFQVKNNVNDWAVSIILGDDGDIILNPRRRQKRKVIAREMTGKSFDLKVRDNGHDYEVYLDGKKVGSGYYDRPKGITNFRWGMYDGTISHDAMIFVTGAKFKKLSRYEQKSIGSEPRREKITNYSNWFKKMPFNKTGKD